MIPALLLLGGILLLGVVFVRRLLRPAPSRPAHEDGVVREPGPDRAERHFAVLPAVLLPMSAFVLLVPLAAAIAEVGGWALFPSVAVILSQVVGLYHLRRKGDLDREHLREMPAILTTAFRYDRAWFGWRAYERVSVTSDS